MASKRIYNTTAKGLAALSDSLCVPVDLSGSTDAEHVTLSYLSQYAQKYASGVGVVNVYGGTAAALGINDLPYYISSRSSYAPIGIYIQSGSKTLVVALDEPDDGMYWASASGSYSGTTITDKQTAYADFNGETYAAAYAPTDTSYAPGYCYAYSAKDSTCGYGIPAGSWWLPSLGELLMIQTHFWQINFALTCLEALGYSVTLLSRSIYWSSTEYSSTQAWNISPSIGRAAYYNKTSYSHRVRPVTALKLLSSF